MDRDHLDFEPLAAYWLGELSTAEAEKVEEHFIACDGCAARLEWLAELSDGVRAACAPARSAWSFRRPSSRR